MPHEGEIVTGYPNDQGQIGGATPVWDVPALASYLTGAPIDGTASGDNTIIAGVSGQIIRVYRMFFTASATVTIQFWDGPSATGTALTGPMSIAPSENFNFHFASMPWFTLTAGNGLVLNVSSAATIGGCIEYTQG